MAGKTSVYQIVTDRIVQAMEKDGLAPWRRTWSRANAPRSIRGHEYRGINSLLLSSMVSGFSDPRWITMAQANKQGGKIRKGERSTIVTFWKFLDKTKKDGTPTGERVPMFRYYRVFNVEQCEGLEIKPISDDETREHNPIQEAEAIIDGWGDACPISHDGGGMNYYRPLTDSIHLCRAEEFKTAADYYATAYHEMIHATGHKTRLDRLKGSGFGSDPYAKEELVAEIGACFLRNLAGLDEPTHLDNSAAYIKGWARRFKDDPKLIVTAAGAAQRAADWILGTKYDERNAGDKKEADSAAKPMPSLF